MQFTEECQEFFEIDQSTNLKELSFKNRLMFLLGIARLNFVNKPC